MYHHYLEKYPMKTNLKYPLYLFLAILLAKIGYVVVESFYNYYVLTTTTQAEVTVKTLEDLNENGHLISAFGLSVLLVPFFYYLVKDKDTKTIYATLGAISIVTFITMYNLLNIAVDKIVSSNKDKRYDAFYITLFKYGMLNNKFSYDSFIDSKKIANNNLDVNDRILLSNSFLLLHADQKLIDKLKQRGKEVVADMYIKKHAQKDYDTKYIAFTDATTQIASLWKEFNIAREKLDTKIKKAEDKAKLKQAHKKLIQTLKKNYKAYIDGYEELNSRLEKETSQNSLNNTYNKLSKYFRYESYDKAKRNYRESMYDSFGHFIEPNIWKDSSGNLTTTHIKKVITDEIMKKAKDKLQGLPMGLSQREFALHIDVKIKLSKRLKRDGIEIPYEFDYSYKQFKKYYTIAVNKKLNKAPKIFYKKLEDKLGKNDLKLDMDWHSFINSKYIRDKISSKVKVSDPKDIANILKAIESKDLGNFKKMVYLPKVIKKIEDEYEFTKTDFLDGHKADKKGDEAIKALYIPPFALAVSILALLLNLVTVLGMSLEATRKVPKKAIFAIKIMFVGGIILTPLVSKYDGFKNPLIEKVSNKDIKTYLSFLNWISYYESINSNWHK